jgi:TRAP-type mannitol/chloroaromatic compound transport system permease small subunit
MPFDAETLGLTLLILSVPAALLPVLTMLPGTGARVAPATRGLARAIDRVNLTVGHAVAWLALFMVLMQLTVVILRYVFGVGSIAMQESIVYAHAFLFMLASGYTLLKGGHVRVDIFYRGAPEKRRALTDFLGSYFLLMPVAVLILLVAMPYVGRSWAIWEGSRETSGIQAVWLLKTAIPVFALLLLWQGVSLAGKAALTLRGFAGPGEAEGPDEAML